MRTGTAIGLHSATALAQVGASASMISSGQPWWAQIVVQAAGIGLQTLFAYLNSISDQNGNKLPPAPSAAQ